MVVIETRIEDLQMTAQGAILGPLWAKIGHFVFPSERWTDFVVVVLGWWLEAIIELRSGTTSCRCFFMDGPFYFEINDLSDGTWGLTCHRRLKEGVERLCATTTTPKDIIEQMLFAANRVIKACNDKGWSTPDLFALVSLHERLKGMLGAAGEN